MTGLSSSLGLGRAGGGSGTSLGMALARFQLFRIRLRVFAADFPQLCGPAEVLRRQAGSFVGKSPRFESDATETSMVRLSMGSSGGGGVREADGSSSAWQRM